MNWKIADGKTTTGLVAENLQDAAIAAEIFSEERPGIRIVEAIAIIQRVRAEAREAALEEAIAIVDRYRATRGETVGETILSIRADLLTLKKAGRR